MVARNQVAADNAISPAAEPRRRPESSSSSSSSSPAAPARPRPCPAVPAPAPGDTHFRTFRSHSDYRRITRTSALLDACGFYWGPLSVHGAHERLRAEPVGTFLVRDSRQRNCFFALSVKMASGPTSIRVHFQAGRFHLDGSRETFDCLFELLEHYVAAPRRMLGAPLRQRRVRPLQELCRQRIVAAVGRENLARIPLNPNSGHLFLASPVAAQPLSTAWLQRALDLMPCFSCSSSIFQGRCQERGRMKHCTMADGI